MRAIFGSISQTWSGKLTDEQQDRWNYAGSQVMSHPSLSQKGGLTGQQFHQAINSVRGCVGLPPASEPPAPVVFSPSVVGRLAITNDESGVRLWLAVSGGPDTDIMVFGQEPCSAGRYKRRNVSYLGLLPPPIGGRVEITHLYKARFGEPRLGRKVFIVTCQTKDGWKGMEQETSARVPEPPKGELAVPEAVTSQNHYMHKGGTRDAEGIGVPSPHLLDPNGLSLSIVSCSGVRSPQVIDSPESCGACSGCNRFQCIGRFRGARGLWTTVSSVPKPPA